MKEKLMKARNSMAVGAMMLMSASPVFCTGESDKLEKAGQEAASGFHSIAMIALKFLLVFIVIAAGITLLAGTQRQREGVREGLGYKIVGVLCIVAGPALAGLIFGWFS